MTSAKTPARKKAIARRRTPVKPPPKAAAKSAAKPAPRQSDAPTKLARLEAALRTKGGATIPDMMEATGWQAHSVRGALAGALKARGLAIVSEKVGGERRYRIVG